MILVSLLMPCLECNHPFEHDGYGCKHSACDCKAKSEYPAIPLYEERGHKYYDLEAPIESWTTNSKHLSTKLGALAVVGIVSVVLGIILNYFIYTYAPPLFLDGRRSFGISIMPFIVACFFFYMARKVRHG